MGHAGSHGLVWVATGLLFLLAVLNPSAARAQRESLPVELPDGPAADGFDVDRFSNYSNGWFDTFYVEMTEPLKVARQDGRLSDGTHMLIVETGAGPLAFIRDQMAYHHIAQGRAGGKNWMTTF